jgi:hypothetical protein
VIAARGEGSGWLERVLQLKLQLANQSNQPERRVALARDLVQLEESLSGKTSDPLHARRADARQHLSEWGRSGERAPTFPADRCDL